MGGVGVRAERRPACRVDAIGEAAGLYPSQYGATRTPPREQPNVPGPSFRPAPETTRRRWGDYVGVARPPGSRTRLAVQRVFRGSNWWATEITQLQTGGTTFSSRSPHRASRSGRHPIALAVTFNTGSPSWRRRFSAATSRSTQSPSWHLTVTTRRPGLRVGTPAPNNNPASSTINFPVGDNRANNLTIPLDTDGKVSAVYRANAGKSTHLIFDVTGYYVAGSAEFEFKTITPVRALDSRPGIGIGFSGPLQKDLPRQLIIDPADVLRRRWRSAETGGTGQTGDGYTRWASNESTPPTSNPTSRLGTRGRWLRIALGVPKDLYIVCKTTASGAVNASPARPPGYYTTTRTVCSYSVDPGSGHGPRGTPVADCPAPFSERPPAHITGCGALRRRPGRHRKLTVFGQTEPLRSATLNSESTHTVGRKFPSVTPGNGAALPISRAVIWFSQGTAGNDPRSSTSRATSTRRRGPRATPRTTTARPGGPFDRPAKRSRPRFTSDPNDERGPVRGRRIGQPPVGKPKNQATRGVAAVVPRRPDSRGARSAAPPGRCYPSGTPPKQLPRARWISPPRRDDRAMPSRAIPRHRSPM